jgi:hypothetical protein
MAAVLIGPTTKTTTTTTTVASPESVNVLN